MDLGGVDSEKSPFKRLSAISFNCATWLYPKPICDPAKSKRQVVMPRRWKYSVVATTTLLCKFPPKGPHGWVTITATLDRRSATRHAWPWIVNVFSAETIVIIYKRGCVTFAATDGFSDQQQGEERETDCLLFTLLPALLLSNDEILVVLIQSMLCSLTYIHHHCVFAAVVDASLACI